MFLGVDSLSSKSSAYFEFFVQEMMTITDSSLAVSFDFHQLGRRLVFRNLFCNIRNWHDNAPMEAWLWQPGGWIAPPKELIVNYNLTCGCRSWQGSSGADGLVGTCTYRSGCLLKNVRVLHWQGVGHRAACSRSEQLIWVHIICLFYLLIILFFLVIYLDYF